MVKGSDLVLGFKFIRSFMAFAVNVFFKVNSDLLVEVKYETLQWNE